MVSGTIETLSEFRGDERWGQVVQYTKEVAELHDIDITSSICPRRTRVAPRRLEDDIIMETTGVREDNITYDQLKTSIYLPVIDCMYMLSELNERFSNHNLDTMQAIQSCNPHSPSFLDPEKLLPIINAYDLNKRLLSEECPLAKRTLTGKNIDSVYEALWSCHPLKSIS